MAVWLAALFYLLGNTAPDVFASIAAFVGKDTGGEVGLNSVLTCVVCGG